MKKLHKHTDSGKRVVSPIAAEKPASPSLLDNILDMYAPVENIRLNTVPNGYEGMQQDAERIGSYFKAAQERMRV